MGSYKMIYAVDFDGTLAKTEFPKIIEPIKETINFCKKIRKEGNILILWTCRIGKDLEDAVKFCKAQGLEFDFINENVPENIEKYQNDTRKVFAHVYIDDKALNPIREKAQQGIYKNAIKRVKLTRLIMLGLVQIVALALSLACIISALKFLV